MSQQLDMPYEHSLDYSSHSFCRSIRMDDHAYPAAFQTEFFANEGALHATGRMVVLLAHPEYGNILFYLRHHLFGWELDLPVYTDEAEMDAVTISAAYPFTLTDSIIEACAGAIDNAHA